MTDFTTKKCQACHGLKDKINYEDALIYLKQIANWALSTDNQMIKRRFEFKNFKQTMFFINALAYLCEKEGHHPDVKFSYNFCEVSFTTHEMGGLSENDFICAAKVDKLISD